LLAAEAAVGGNRTKLGGTRQAGRNVAADSIDILVDLKGYTKTWHPGAGVRCRSSSVARLSGALCVPLADYVTSDPIVTLLETAGD
jgi:predicted O-linked N-acetylglucosamine transferase (SPINDLY family)